MHQLIRLTLAVVGLVALAGCGKAQPLGKLDLRSIDGYVKRLNTSDTAEAKAIRKQLADASAARTREWAAVQRDGLPVDPDELQRPSPPPDQDAAPDYVRLTALLKAKPIPDDARDALYAVVGSREPSAAEVSVLRRLLAERRDIVDLIRQATGKPQCVFQRKWSLGPMTLTPEYAYMRSAARLIRAESFLLARDGRCEEAIREQLRGFRLAEHAGSDPSIISHLVGIAIDHLALGGVEDILRRAGPNVTLDDSVARLIEQQAAHLDARWAYASEMASLVVTMQMIRKDSPEKLWQLQADMSTLLATLSNTGNPPPAPRQTLNADDRRFVSELLDASEASVVRDLHRLAANTSRPPWERIAADSQVEAQAEGASNPVTIVRSVLMPVYQGIAANDARMAARREVLMAAAKLLAWKARHESYPARLEDAAGKTIDPFTGKPLQYRREGGGFVVYSAGQSGHFDGGRPGQRVSPDKACFRYPDLRHP